MKIMNTLYVTGHRTRLGLQKGTLTVADPDRGWSRVPLSTLEAIVILSGAQVTSHLLAECARRRVRLTALKRSGGVRFTVGGPLSGNVHLRLAQVRTADSPRATTALCRSFVAGKLQNCRSLLRRWAWDEADPDPTWVLKESVASIGRGIEALSHAYDPDRIRGIEGDGTRRYFQGMRATLFRSGLSFTVRTRRPPRDPVNALLSFVYGLALSEIIGALESVGLDPQIGFLHGFRPGRPALALDMIEEMRPAVCDRFAVRCIKRSQVGAAHFTFTPGGACYLSDDGRVAVLKLYETFREEQVQHRLLDRSVPRWSLPSIQATLLARRLRGDLSEYAPYLMSA